MVKRQNEVDVERKGMCAGVLQMGLGLVVLV